MEIAAVIAIAMFSFTLGVAWIPDSRGDSSIALRAAAVKRQALRCSKGRIGWDTQRGRSAARLPIASSLSRGVRLQKPNFDSRLRRAKLGWLDRTRIRT
jgi:hypothetical protein